MGLLPRRVESERAPESARVLDIEGVEADRAFEALSSETARRILSHIYEQPSTPPEVRDEVGTSLQNVHYHLGRLEEADLIEPAGVGYSEKGNEMTIFAPKSEAVVLFAGHEHDRSRLSRLLGRVLGLYLFLAVAVAAAGSLRELLAPAAPTADQGVSLATESAADGGSAGGVATGTARGGLESLLVNPDPLLVFFLGGLVAIVVLTGYWYATGR
jgi:DNA-binding transcriptional ArsR family regulator